MTLDALLLADWDGGELDALSGEAGAVDAVLAQWGDIGNLIQHHRQRWVKGAQSRISSPLASGRPSH
jgi:hypothetical protein